MNMGGQIAGAVTALMTPLIAKYFGWNTPFFVAAGLCCLGALFWLWVDIDRGTAALTLLRVEKPKTQTLGAQNV
jgi:sugar phosphate permease